MLEMASPPAMKNLSVSKIESALLCPRCFKFKYIDKIPQPTSGTLHSGNVVHACLEHALREFAKTGEYPSWQELDDLYGPTWDQKRAEEEAKPWFLSWEWPEPEQRMKETYRPLVRLARDEILPTIRPWMIGAEPVVEYRVDLELESPIGPFKLLGYVDLLEDRGILVDWKTTDGEVSKRARRTWLQFAGYSLWAYPIVGEEVLQCQKIFLIRGDRPSFEIVQFEIGPEHREYFVDVAAQVWNMIDKGIFLPITDTWLCQPKFCPFYEACQGSVVKRGS